MEILTREEQNNFIDSLPDELWCEWVLLMGDITSFYSGIDSMKMRRNDDLNPDDSIARILSLLNTDENKLNIEFFREFFRQEVDDIGGKFKRLKPFPDYYHPKDNLLSKNEDAELTFYFAVKNCISYKNSKKIYDLLTATRLRGYAVGLSGIKGLLLPKYHKDIKTHDLGGQAVANKAELAKNQVLTLWNDRFNNPILTKKGKEEFGRYIYDNPHLITDEQGNSLKKPNGEKYYNSPTTVVNLLPKLK